MINITFTGNIFHQDGSPANNVKYQGLFIKVNNNSSETIWDTPRISETNQYNFNLGDSTWLSQQAGYATPNDKVILCFWLNNTSNREDLNLIEWCFIEWELDQRDVYIQDIQLRSATNPNCSFSFSVSGVNETSYIYDITSNDNHMWIYEDKEHYQYYQWDEYDIFNISQIPQSAVSIDWGDGNIDSDLSLSDSPYSHIYDASGEIDVTVVLTNTSNKQCSASFNDNVLYKVYNGLEWTPNIYLNNVKEFTPVIYGDTDRITSVDYYIDGFPQYVNMSYDDVIQHTFLNPGNHIIKQCIKFNDGIEDQIQCEDYEIELDTWVTFESSEADCGLQFFDTSNIGVPPIKKYQWDVYQGVFVLAHVEGVSYESWSYNWPYKGTFQVRLAITDANDNVYSATKEYIIDVCLGDQTGGGSGGGSPWIYNETKYVERPLPKINIVKVDDIDDTENRRILILEIKDDDII